MTPNCSIHTRTNRIILKVMKKDQKILTICPMIQGTRVWIGCPRSKMNLRFHVELETLIEAKYSKDRVTNLFPYFGHFKLLLRMISWEILPKLFIHRIVILEGKTGLTITTLDHKFYENIIFCGCFPIFMKKFQRQNPKMTIVNIKLRADIESVMAPSLKILVVSFQYCSWSKLNDVPICWHEKANIPNNMCINVLSEQNLNEAHCFSESKVTGKRHNFVRSLKYLETLLIWKEDVSGNILSPLDIVLTMKVGLNIVTNVYTV